jgi:hypothetical protein
MARTRLRVALLAALSTSAALSAALEGCPAPSAKPTDPICTPGAYVFCRCESRQEGTKLCLDNAVAFAKCECGENGQPVQLIPSGDAGFLKIDAAVPPSDKPPIDAKCAGKIAVIASTDQEDPADPQAPLYLYGAAYDGNGAWTVARSTGAALRGQPRGGLIGPTLVAVWLSRSNQVAWTKFEANQKTLSPPDKVGDVLTTKNPAFVTSQATGRLYSLSPDDMMKEGVFSLSAAWDDGNALVAPGDSPVVGKTAPAAALAGSSYVLAFGAANKALSVQTQVSGNWGPPATIPDASTYADFPPVMTSLIGGTEELLMVYIDSDLSLHWTTRSSGTWGPPAVVDTSAIPDGVPSLAPMAGGRAMLVWKTLNGAAMFSQYDPSKTPPWSSPASIFQDGPKLTFPPSVGGGRCASEATVAYLDASGRVNLALYAGGRWMGPYVVPGMTNMTFAGAGEVP